MLQAFLFSPSVKTFGFATSLIRGRLFFWRDKSLPYGVVGMKGVRIATLGICPPGNNKRGRKISYISYLSLKSGRGTLPAGKTVIRNFLGNFISFFPFTVFNIYTCLEIS